MNVQTFINKGNYYDISGGTVNIYNGKKADDLNADDLVASAIRKVVQSGIMKFKNDWQPLAYGLIEFCGWEKSPNAVYNKLEELGFTSEDECAFPCDYDSLRKDFIYKDYNGFKRASVLDRASKVKFSIVDMLKKELENCGILR